MFPVRRLARKLKKASQLHVGIAPAIFLAAVLQYLITEIFDLTLSEPQLTDSHINCNIKTEQIRRFMKEDGEFNDLTRDCIIPLLSTKKNEEVFKL